MEQRAQGAIEYLLIIGAAILVVAIVILAVTGALGGGKTATTSSSGDYNRSICAASCTGLGGDCRVGNTGAVAQACGGISGCPITDTCK